MTCKTSSVFIGLSCEVARDPEGFPDRLGVRRSYLGAVEAAGGIPLLIPFGDNRRVQALYDLCAGILIPGGADVNPRHYNEEPSPHLGKTCSERDELEIGLIRRAAADGKPLLGICRGMQIINVALGGSLYQDISDQVPGSHEHQCENDFAEFCDLTEEITVQSGTKLAALLQSGKFFTNSAHHQAVKVPAPGLVISALSRDGIYEALEKPDHPFLMAVQSHPEVLWNGKESGWSRLFEAFVKAAEAYRRS